MRSWWLQHKALLAVFYIKSNLIKTSHAGQTNRDNGVIGFYVWQKFPSKHQNYFSKAHYVIGRCGQCSGQIRLLYTLIRVTRKSSRLFQVMKTPGPVAGDSCSKDQRFTNSANIAAFCCITGLCYREHFPGIFSNDRCHVTVLACVTSVSVQVRWESWNESEKTERRGRGFLFSPPHSPFFRSNFLNEFALKSLLHRLLVHRLSSFISSSAHVKLLRYLS